MNDDLISRQAAISALCNACGKIDCDKMDKCEKLQLPPANCSEFPNSSDCISRQAAIDRINKQREHLQPDIFPQDRIGDAAYRICAEFIGRLPPAQPERKKGCKIVKGTGTYGYCACDQCGKPVHPEDKFCSNCGADFREDT